MGKKVDKGFWLSVEGLALLGGWRRQGDELDVVADKAGVCLATLKRWGREHEEIGEILRRDREVVYYMVEKVLLDKGLAGDQKAGEYWLRYRGLGVAGDDVEVEDRGMDYVGLAGMINVPRERE